MKFNHDLTGKTAVVTGAGGVLCSMFSRVLAENGARVALLDLNYDAAAACAKEIGDNAYAFKADCLNKESLEQTCNEVLEKLGHIDILINGAGGNNPRGTTADEMYDAAVSNNFFGLDDSGVRFVLELNYMGTLLPTQVFAKHMTENGGVIINISSMNAFRPLTKIPAYSGAKAAVSNLTEWLAVYFAKSGIRVNAIAPGFFVTNQNRDLLFDGDGNPTARTEKILRATPMGRFGEAEELCGTLMWLVDNNASGFVTGTVIPVDGGFSAYSGV